MKWEYKRVQTYHLEKSEDLDSLLADLGEQEWELVMPFGQLLVFKRPKKMSYRSESTKTKKK